MSRRVLLACGPMLACGLLLWLSACAGWRFEPSRGTGAADQGATAGFGLEASPYSTR